MNAIELDSVSKKFKNLHIFRDASATFQEGKTYAITGPNGSGKSVLFKIITGLMRHDSGNVFVSPKFLDDKRTFPRDFGVTIDRPGYIAGLTGFENLQLLAKIQNKIGVQEIRAAMRAVNLDPDLKSKVRGYSLGMKQRLAIAQAVMENPKVLLLDEPFNGLDSESVQLVRDIILSRKALGNTIIFTSHNPDDIKLLADEVYEIADFCLKTTSSNWKAPGT